MGRQVVKANAKPVCVIKTLVVLSEKESVSVKRW